MNNYSNTPKLWNTKMIVIVSLIAGMTLAILASAIFIIIANPFETQDSQAQTSLQPAQLIILNCPEQITSDSSTFTVDGIILSAKDPCTLSINGEVVSSTSMAGNQMKWSKTFKAKAGKTESLVFELKENNNIIDTQTRDVFCQPLQVIEKKTTTKKDVPLTPGCSLVKKKSGGLNIRVYPGTEYYIIDYISANDYTSKMIYTGYYYIGSGGYTWYEIISPSGKHGYVRSDLVRSVA